LSIRCTRMTSTPATYGQRGGTAQTIDSSFLLDEAL